jgi:hypothetical protein
MYSNYYGTKQQPPAQKEYYYEMTIDEVISYLKEGKSKYPNEPKIVNPPTITNMVKGL